MSSPDTNFGGCCCPGWRSCVFAASPRPLAISCQAAGRRGSTTVGWGGAVQADSRYGSEPSFHDQRLEVGVELKTVSALGHIYSQQWHPPGRPVPENAAPRCSGWSSWYQHQPATPNNALPKRRAGSLTCRPASGLCVGANAEVVLSSNALTLWALSNLRYGARPHCWVAWRLVVAGAAGPPAQRELNGPVFLRAASCFG
jgi:hypothetical protein